MSRYRGPRFKKIRRLGALPGLTSKDLKNQLSSRTKSGYCVRLEEKQKLRFHYGLTERQLLRYVHMARKAKGSTGQVLLQLLEMRLDNILFRLDMALTIPNARQLVNHRHILVNGRIVDIPSYRCKPRDIITTKEKEKSHTLVQNSIEKRKYQRILIEKERLEKERLKKERKERLEKEEEEKERLKKERKERLEKEEEEKEEEEKEEERYEILVLKNWIEKEEKEEKEKKKKPKCQQFVVPKKLPDHLTLDSYQSKYKGFVNKIIDSQSACLKIQELLVVEYYSRQT